MYMYAKIFHVQLKWIKYSNWYSENRILEMANYSNLRFPFEKKVVYCKFHTTLYLRYLCV